MIAREVLTHLTAAQYKTPLRTYVSSDETASTGICSRTAPQLNL